MVYLSVSPRVDIGDVKTFHGVYLLCCVVCYALSIQYISELSRAILSYFRKTF